MADEVIIEEYGALPHSGVPVPTQWLTTQVLDIGVAAAALNAQTKYVRIRSKDVGFWYNFAGAAAAGL